MKMRVLYIICSCNVILKKVARFNTVFNIFNRFYPYNAFNTNTSIGNVLDTFRILTYQIKSMGIQIKNMVLGKYLECQHDVHVSFDQLTYHHSKYCNYTNTQQEGAIFSTNKVCVTSKYPMAWKIREGET